MDYYSLLGVSPAASLDEVKSTYKKLALKHHPDKGGDPQYFSKLTEAYNYIKSDIQLDTAEVMDSYFYPSKNLRLTETIDFKEQYTGKILNLKYKTLSNENKIFTVNIPAGISHNQTLKFDNINNDSFYKPTGNLLLTIKVKNKTGIRRDQDDIYLDYDVNVLDLLTGANLEIVLPCDTKVSLFVKKGTQNNTVYRISNYGIPNLSTGIKGDVFVKIKAIVPMLDNEQCHLINTIK